MIVQELIKVLALLAFSPGSIPSTTLRVSIGVLPEIQSFKRRKLWLKYSLLAKEKHQNHDSGDSSSGKVHA